ncbi:MAG: phosphate acyltransferase PlsX [Oscillospiraceae bacterium]|nr:phosphate acyltransferase PlsX [Oscillospiraceae bacterium]
MRIIVDAMGGDNAPQAPVQGALRAIEEYGVDVVLVGRGEDILEALQKEGVAELPPGLSISHAGQVVDMCDNPATAFKEKKDSSLTVGLNLLKNGEGDAFVSAGSTGALLSGATLLVKRIKGIRRAAMAPVVPTGNGGSVLIDCGATAEGTPEFLLQFAFMGSYYAERVLGRPEPKVGLLNIGSEPSKGTDLQREAYKLLQKAKEEGRIDFVGNVEAREAVEGAVDVIVADGYSGNIFLKAVEGAGLFLTREMKKMFTKSVKTKLAALLMKDGLRDFKKLLDSNEVGGTALVGISRPVIKAHGSSNGYAIKNAIRQAVEFSRSGIIEDIAENVEHMRLAGRPVPSDGGEGQDDKKIVKNTIDSQP